jgi:hypothetical protein
MPIPLPASLIAQLNATHSALLTLHKALIDHEQARYTRLHGPIGGPNDAFNLLIGDPFFAWLRPMTTLIVEIDEFVSAKPTAPRNPEEGLALLTQTDAMLTPPPTPPLDTGETFQHHYGRALQDSPDVAAAHAEWKLLLQQFDLPHPANDGTSNPSPPPSA